MTADPLLVCVVLGLVVPALVVSVAVADLWAVWRDRRSRMVDGRDAAWCDEEGDGR